MDSLNLYLYLYYKEAKELKTMMHLDNLYPHNIWTVDGLISFDLMVPINLMVGP
jgi:hypothetical protein